MDVGIVPASSLSKFNAPGAQFGFPSPSVSDNILTMLSSSRRDPKISLTQIKQSTKTLRAINQLEIYLINILRKIVFNRF